MIRLGAGLCEERTDIGVKLKEHAMRALILLADGYEDSEFFYPYYRLQEEGIAVDVAGPKTGSVTGKHGYVFETNRALSDVRAKDYDVLILPGGKAPERIRLHPQAVDVTKNMMNDGKVLAAICHGGQILISADVLGGRRATCYEAIRDDMMAAGASYVDEEVVVDGNLITSRRPSDLPAFCRELLRALKQATVA
jgi:protease I